MSRGPATMRPLAAPAVLALALVVAGCGAGAGGGQIRPAETPPAAPSPAPAAPPTAEAKICRSDADCPKGFSCWSLPPRGPLAGTRGSPERPGTCWSEEVLRQMY